MRETTKALPSTSTRSSRSGAGPVAFLEAVALR